MSGHGSEQTIQTLQSHPGVPSQMIASLPMLAINAMHGQGNPAVQMNQMGQQGQQMLVHEDGLDPMQRNSGKPRPSYLATQLISCACGMSYRFDKRSGHLQTSHHSSWQQSHPEEWQQFEEKRIAEKKARHQESLKKHSVERRVIPSQPVHLVSSYPILPHDPNAQQASFIENHLLSPLSANGLLDYDSNIKFRCACGAEYLPKNRTVHFRSQQHGQFITSPLFQSFSSSQQQALLDTNHNVPPPNAGSDFDVLKCECGGMKSSRNHWYSLKHVTYLRNGKTGGDGGDSFKRKRDEEDDEGHLSNKMMRAEAEWQLPAATVRCLARSKSYKEEKKDQIREKSTVTVQCICSHEYRLLAKTSHNRSAHHIEYIKAHPLEWAEFEKQEATAHEERVKAGISARLEARRTSTLAKTTLPLLDPTSAVNIDEHVKYACPCGGTYTGRSRTGHINSQAHKKYFDSEEKVQEVTKEIVPSNSPLPSYENTILCACGVRYEIVNRVRHYHSKRHQGYLSGPEFQMVAAAVDSTASFTSLLSLPSLGGGSLPVLSSVIGQNNSGNNTIPSFPTLPSLPNVLPSLPTLGSSLAGLPSSLPALRGMNNIPDLPAVEMPAPGQAISKFLASVEGTTQLTAAFVKPYIVQDPNAPPPNPAALLTMVPMTPAPSSRRELETPLSASAAQDANTPITVGPLHLPRIAQTDSKENKRASKVSCECGGTYTKNNKWCHVRTNRHLQYLNSIGELPEADADALPAISGPSSGSLNIQNLSRAYHPQSQSAQLPNSIGNNMGSYHPGLFSMPLPGLPQMAGMQLSMSNIPALPTLGGFDQNFMDLSGNGAFSLMRQQGFAAENQTNQVPGSIDQSH